MRPWVVPVIAALLLAALPAVLTPYTQDLVVKIAIYAVFALSLELLVGAAGLVSLGHAAFLGIGAYVTVMATGDGGAASALWLLPAAMGAAALYAIFVGTVVVERRRFGQLMPTELPSRGARWLRGPWPLTAGAIGLMLVNLATLLLAGRPWGITSAFALWGAKFARSLGVPIETWPYWSTPGQLATLNGSVFRDVTSVMDGGIVVGALLAALLAGRFRPQWSVPARSLAAAVIGGLLLGYGARVAYGCNIGAYFSGIASGSLHGWLWLPAAFAGNTIGTYLRPTFGLGVERTALPKC